MTADYLAPARHGQAWAATGDGPAAGFILIPGHLLAENVSVLPAAQGRGMGAQLLALAEHRARRLRLPELRLCTSQAMTENLACCPPHGYTETHQAQQGGFHRVYFRKRLDS